MWIIAIAKLAKKYSFQINFSLIVWKNGYYVLAMAIHSLPRARHEAKPNQPKHLIHNELIELPRKRKTQNFGNWKFSSFAIVYLSHIMV